MSKLSDAQEELEDLRTSYGDVFNEMHALFSATRREHEDYGHEGHFRWCNRPVCAHVREIEDTLTNGGESK